MKDKQETPEQPTTKKGFYVPKWVVYVLLVVVVLALTFALGEHVGSAHQKKKDATNSPFASGATSTFIRHQVLVGSVTSVSSSKIVVESDSKTSLSASVSKTTITTNTKQQTVTPASIKAGSRVVVTAAVNKDGSLAAQRILVLS